MDENETGTRIADINGDGSVTIADLGSWLGNVLVLPGDGLISLLMTQTPAVAGFLGLGREDFGGPVSVWISIVLWLGALILAGTLINAVRDFDRSATAWIARGYRELGRCGRVCRRRLVTRLAPRSQRNAADGAGLSVDAIRLANAESTILRCLAGIEDGAVMTIEEIAARIHCPERKAKTFLNRLVELGFVEPATDSLTRTGGHRIAAAGQMYLLGA